MNITAKYWIEFAKRDLLTSEMLKSDRYLANDDIYIDSRYPGEMGLLPEGFPTKEQAEKVYLIAENIFNQIFNILSEVK